MRRAIFALVFLSLSQARAEEAGGVTWEKSVAAAKERAAKEKRPIVIDFWASWCGWCKVQDREVFSKPKMAEFTKGMIFVKLNTEDGGDGTKLARNFGISGLPTVLVMDATEHEVDRITGFHKIDDFIPRLQAILDGKGELQLLSKKPDPTPQDLDKLASLYVDRGNVQMARDSWEGILKKDPDNKQGITDDTMLKLAALAYSQGQLDDAKKQLEALIKKFPNEASAASAKSYLQRLDSAPRGGAQAPKLAHYDTLPGVDLATLPADKRAKVLERANKETCTCGCPQDTIAQCLNTDPQCAVAPRLVQQIVNEVTGTKASK
ncbi:MAG: thioredoxin family protein [Acidobacteriota bacterium]